jgi:hypothetical protein
MITYWAPGRRFADYHGVALRYLDADAAAKRMEEPNFPKENCVDVQYCNECGCFHIVRDTDNGRL